MFFRNRGVKFWIWSSLVCLVILLLIGFTTKRNKPQSTDISVSAAKARTEILKTFEFPVTDAAGKTVTKLKYEISDAELRDEIIVRGQRAKTIQGRLFLILTIKISNEYDKGLEINGKDYIRLSVNGKVNELIAPDIHNDPVAVQPISTKTTRVGFAINETDKDLVLHVGEIKKPKEQIPVIFNK